MLGKLGLVFGYVGPGLFLIGYNIGTGSVTTMASAGSRYSMSLFWLLVLSCAFTWIMIVAYGKFTAVSGQTAMWAYRQHLPLGSALAAYTIVGMSLGAMAGIAGVMAIVADMIHEWTAVLFGFGFSRLWTAVVILSICYFLLWFGKYPMFEKFLVVLVVVMGVSFSLSLFMVIPEPGTVLAGLVPGVPDEENAFLIMSAIAGTTSGALLFVMRSLLVAEKGWSVKDLRHKNIDAAVSVVLMLLISGAIMACAAGTLYRMGVPVERAVDMVATLEPIAGRFAMSVFVTGIIGAGVSSIFPVAVVLPWLISDFRNTSRDPRSAMFRALGGFALACGLIVPVFGGRPVWVMIGATAFQTTMMPIVSLAILVLVNRRDLMGPHKAGFWLNAGIGANVVFSFAIAWLGIRGLLGM